MTNADIEIRDGRVPLVHAPPRARGSFAPWIAEHRAALRAALLRHGHLMVRGLGIADPAGFAEVRDAVTDQRAAYKEKATPRSDYGDDIFSSTDLPAAQSIALHNENSYTLEFPGLLMFCCLEAPERGGATIVGDVRRVLAGIPPALAERFRAKGWLLRRNYHRHVGLTWATAFGATSRAEIEAYCARNLIGCEWLGETNLRTAQRRSAIVRHPATGEDVWFNHAAFWNRWSLEDEVLEVLVDSYGDDGLPFDTAFGDGEPIAKDDVAALNAAYDAATLREAWQPGDVLLVDNILSAHGRDSFRGNRRILVAMGEPVQLSACSAAVAPSPSAG